MILHPGDCASVISPAAQLGSADRNLLSEAVLLLESWGLTVKLRTEDCHHFYLAGPDNVRVAHLNAALADPETKVIFCTRGGYGSPRLISHINSETVSSSKILVGYSDITALHLAISRIYPNVELVHGPNIATRQLLGPDATCAWNRQALHDALFNPAYSVDEPVEVLIPGQAAGPLVGGCLSLVVSTLGTRYAPLTKGKVLFLEDAGEAPYRVDRMMVQLRNAGAFQEVRGVILGIMKGCVDPYNDLREIMVDVLAREKIPVAFGLASGHGPKNIPLRLGNWGQIDGASGRFRLLPQN